MDSYHVCVWPQGSSDSMVGLARTNARGQGHDDSEDCSTGEQSSPTPVRVPSSTSQRIIIKGSGPSR